MLVFAATVIIIGSAVIGGLQNNELVTSVLDVFAAKTSDLTNANGGAAAVGDVIESSAIDDIVYVGFWALTGSLVYMILQILTKGLEPVKDVFASLGHGERHRGAVIVELTTQMILRVIFIFVATAYVFIIKDLLIPFAVAVTTYAVGLPAFSMVMNIVLASVVLMVGLHLLTVLLRMAALRLRVFGGADLSL